VGFLHTEGIVRTAADIDRVGDWRDEDDAFAENVVTVWLRDGLRVRPDQQRQFYATSSCGICGKASIEAALGLAPPLAQRASIQPQLLYQLPEALRTGQRVFDQTGGLHASALFDATGSLVNLREDVGRHNALDKLIGHGLLNGLLPFQAHILLVSGRVSFEIVQKALVARIPIIAAISAPSSLAVLAARQCKIALVGFLRDGRLNEY
jgi:FdhD protein